ncbi:WXG100 family type VII secretion target [Promicromonospora sp. Populi]|uniref:WXG100 family type VII secretion target n=1 Tax=Promicromonospora sp. Populi TaxID=3239420 RepID=UPI0034E23472
MATVRTEVGALMRNLDALQASWQGPAAAAFSGTVAQWRGAQAQVEGALDTIQSALSAAARTYAEAEAATTRLFS